MLGSKLKISLIVLLVLLPTLIITALTFYFLGIRKFGTPGEYRKTQEQVFLSVQDSVHVEREILSPENIGDSTMVGMEKHANILEDTERYEKQISDVQAALDTIKKEKTELEAKEKTVADQQSLLVDLREKASDERVANLAKIYDNMKFKQAVPLFLAMDDTLAVLILSNMQERNSAKLLGAVAEADVEKAKKINKLLSMMGTDIPR